MDKKLIIKLLEIRDALVIGNIEEAYHTLYSIADPTFEKCNPWKEWESVLAMDS